MPSVTAADRLQRAPTVEPITEPDQWTVGNQLRSLRPLWKYSYSNIPGSALEAREV
jgi:hypothetical protein